MKFNLKNLLMAPVFFASTLNTNAQSAEIKGNLELGASNLPTIQTNLRYRLPWCVEGFTFINYEANSPKIFKDGGEYHSRTTISKKVTHGLFLETQSVHQNELFTRQGFGIGWRERSGSGDYEGSISAIPAWLAKNEEGKIRRTKNHTDLKYDLSFDLPKDLFFRSFGQANVVAEGWPKWDYGETTAGIYLGRNDRGALAYKLTLDNEEGKFKPEHRAMFSLEF